MFSKGERNGLIGLLLLTLIIIVLPTILINKAEKGYIRVQNKKDSLLLAEIDSAFHLQTIQYNKNPRSPVENRFNKESTPKKIININTAGKEELMSLPGIGEVFSDRIIKYRERLGGFNNISQLKEVYGMQEETYSIIRKQITCDKKTRKVNINLATEEQLKIHPYIPYKLAKQIVSYREKVHPYTKPEDIKALYFMNDTIYQQLAPYIMVE